MDDDDSGNIETIELKQAFNQISVNFSAIFQGEQTDKEQTLKKKKSLTESDINSIIEKVDYDGNGLIDYSEFLTHTLTKKQLSQQNVTMFFNIMQAKGDAGRAQEELELAGNHQDGMPLSAELISSYFLVCGRNRSLEDIKEMMEEDKTGLVEDKGISEENFYDFMTSFLKGEISQE